ncbi:MAG: DUF4230 domain-containing protein [Bacteroidota bacterium]
MRASFNALAGICLLLLVASCQDRRGLAIGKIKAAAALATTEFKVDKLVWGVKDKRILWFIQLNQAQFLAKSQAIIKAGIDLDKMGEDDIEIKGSRISLTLPHIEVINFSYPSEKFEKVDILTTNAFSTKIDLDDQERFFQEAEIDIRNHLERMGIVKTTQQKTRIMLEAMLRNLGYTEIYIQFKTGPLITKVDLQP